MLTIALSHILIIGRCLLNFKDIYSSAKAFDWYLRRQIYWFLNSLVIILSAYLHGIEYSPKCLYKARILFCFVLVWYRTILVRMMTSSNGKKYPCYWPFVRGIHRSPVNYPHKGQWRGAFMFSLICAWTNGWVIIRDADYRRHNTHYDLLFNLLLCAIFIHKYGIYIHTYI